MFSSQGAIEQKGSDVRGIAPPPVEIGGIGLGLRARFESEMVASGISTEGIESILNFYKPDVVGMSVLTAPQVVDFESHSIFIKENFPDIKVVWGGPHPTLLSNLCMKSKYIDHVFVGQVR
jgi:hypothetical protein